MIKIFNSLSRQLEEFTPLKKGKAGLYTCGPTVYNYAHIGNLRTYIFEDVLKRALMMNGFKVTHVMNITDVGHLTSDSDTGEDKMEKGAKREGKTAWDIAKFYTEAFLNDMRELNVLPANELPRATDHIKEQVSIIKKLEKNGYTYTTADGVYFDTSKFPNYGRLANLQKQELKAGARVEMGEKKNPTDFALWKFSPSGERRQMEWESPWGIGFPGWHIECSAMAAKYLGQPFDIHSGGIDHIPVHHTNEIAQSEAAEGKPLAQYWMHGEFLLIPGGDKMAKSGENFITLNTVKEKGFSPLAYRYLLLQTHYRKQLTFSWDALRAAQNGLEHLYNSAQQLSETKTKDNQAVSEAFMATINNDLDTPAALALVWEALKNRSLSVKQLLAFDSVLGLQIKEQLAKKDEVIPDEVIGVVRERDKARAAKDWARSDELRKKLEDMGYEVKDTKEGTDVTKK